MTTPQYAPTSLDTKIISFRKDAVRLNRGEMVAPTMAIVYPTSGCNMRCYGCIANAENTRSHMLDVGVFRQLVSEFAALGGESIEFSGGGEPTIHPHYPDLLRIIAERGLKFGIITNGTQEKWHAETVALASYVRMSVYTVNQVPQLRSLVKLRNEGRNYRCRIGGKLLLGKSDVPSVRFLAAEIIDAGADYISIKAKRHCADDPQRLSITERRNLEEVLGELRDKYPGKVFGSIEKTYQHGSCWLSPLHTVVDAWGKVWICCYFQDRTDDIGIGNLHENSFSELWYGDAHKQAMERVDTDQCNHYDCRFHVYHDVLNAELRTDGHHLSFI